MLVLTVFFYFGFKEKWKSESKSTEYFGSEKIEHFVFPNFSEIYEFFESSNEESSSNLIPSEDTSESYVSSVSQESDTDSESLIGSNTQESTEDTETEIFEIPIKTPMQNDPSDSILCPSLSPTNDIILDQPLASSDDAEMFLGFPLEVVARVLVIFGAVVVLILAGIVLYIGCRKGNIINPSRFSDDPLLERMETL